MQTSRFSIPVISIKHRLPLLIGILLLGIILATTLASYNGVKESAFDVGRERLQNLTKQLASLLQQSNNLLLSKTFTAANDPAIKAFFQSPSPATRSGWLIRAVSMITGTAERLRSCRRTSKPSSTSSMTSRMMRS